MVKFKYIKLYAHNTHGIFLDGFKVYKNNSPIETKSIKQKHISDNEFLYYVDTYTIGIFNPESKVFSKVLGNFSDVFILFKITPNKSLDTPVKIEISIPDIPEFLLNYYPNVKYMLYGYRIALLNKDMEVVAEQEISITSNKYFIEFK